MSSFIGIFIAMTGLHGLKCGAVLWGDFIAL